MIDIYIENSTEDDATVKVSPGGPPPKEKEPKKPGGQTKASAPVASERVVRAGRTETVSVSPCPTCVVRFMIEVGKQRVASEAIEGLKLTRDKGDKNRYAIEVIRNGRKPKA
jgi:hypothetical protein